MGKYVPSAATVSTVNEIFTYHSPKGDQPERYVAIREKAKELALLMVENCPESRELLNAINHLQLATMLANASIACNE